MAKYLCGGIINSMCYKTIRPLLFKLSPETAHHLALGSLKALSKLHLYPAFQSQDVSLKKHVMGLDFPNVVGLGAGLDKNGEYLDGLARLGFGFIEIGTVTPKPQEGNPKPRMFRLPKHHALINRMGFNNKGVGYLVGQVKKSQYKGILGINIGKNKITPNEQAIDDYIDCLRQVYQYASYITINISSPNTPGLRHLQFGEELRGLLQAIKNEQQNLSQQYSIYKPVAVKISPDVSHEEIAEMAQCLLDNDIDGVIACNTTLSREAVAQHPRANETGGLSGQPLAMMSTHVITHLAQALQNQIPIIGLGGIETKTDMQAKLDAGASLVQVYTGLIYQGPGLVKQLLS